MPFAAQAGIERVASSKGYAATIEQLTSMLNAKGLILFAKIDFSADAKRAGLQMAPTQLLIFGNPVAGTPVMVAAPTSALDLPLKILVSEDADGKVWLSYSTPEFLAERHGIPARLLQNIAGIRALAKAGAEG
jgi:uncharacterized protein (DUF302 family)